MYEWPEYSLVVGEKLVRISIKQHCWYKHSEQMEVKKTRSPKEKEREKKKIRVQSIR